MNITKVKMKDFKSYESVEFDFDPKFNVVIGENNIGKSTVFEALQLWKRCYDACINAHGNDFYAESVPLYIPFPELYFLRLTKGNDLFWGQKRSCEIYVVFQEFEREFELGFKLSVPQVTDSYIRLSRLLPEQFRDFKDFLRNQGIRLGDFLFIQQTAPIANVLSKEPYMYKGQVIKKIEKGKSDEVLRNKVLFSIQKGSNLKDWMQQVLEIPFEFKLPTRSAREKEEYIDLQVENEGKKLDIYLQGSGFLQTAEILSTIEVMDNALNVMLIDEPDSHISPRIQNNLLKCLKEISNVQIFLISHNDNFVSEVEPSKIIFVNSENKSLGHISALDDVNIDTLHESLGGIVSGLTRLHSSKKVIFVEGEDDITYIRNLNKAFERIGCECALEFNKLSFWYVRGKDYIPQKIRTGKQMISQAVRNCNYAVILDKDYSTVSANDNFKRSLGSSLGNNSFVHTHNGYCIESVLFSDIEKLKRFINKLINQNEIYCDEYINRTISELKVAASTVTNPLFLRMKEKFNSQKKSSRQELNNVEFDAFLREAVDSVQFLMNKENIKQFVVGFEEMYDIKLFERDDDCDETVASGLLNAYIDSIESEEDIYDDYLTMFNYLKCL